MRNHGNNFEHIQLPQEKHINVQQSINQTTFHQIQAVSVGFRGKQHAMKGHGDS
jgi:hypothetical protein